MTLTVGDLRGYITSGLTDPALQKLLDAAYEAIGHQSGAAGAVTEFAVGGYSTLILDRQASAITSVTERIGGVDVVLAANDYRHSGYVLTRLDTGTNPRSTWADTTTVYDPVVDAAEWDRVAVALVELDLNYSPGVTSERIGDWEETKADNSAMNYAIERETILASLGSGPVMTLVSDR